MTVQFVKCISNNYRTTRKDPDTEHIVVTHGERAAVFLSSKGHRFET